MGNPMTPFVPPAPAFKKSTVKLYASVIDAAIVAGGIGNGYYLSSEQTKNDIFYMLGTSTNITGIIIYFPLNTEAKTFTFHNNLTLASSSLVMGLGASGFSVARNLYPSIMTTWDFWPLGATAATTECWQRTSATNIAYDAV